MTFWPGKEFEKVSHKPGHHFPDQSNPVPRHRPVKELQAGGLKESKYLAFKIS